MKTNVEDFIGKKNNKLTVVGFEKPNTGRLKLRCICDCGNEKYCFPYQFTSGDVKSCGCISKGKKGPHNWDNGRKSHGMSKHPFYKKWNDMIRRCYNENEPAYRYYGARGIEVCDKWRSSPVSFIAWCVETHPGGSGLSLDRIDGAKDYSPGNCRWATQIEQVHNLKNNRFVTINGESKCVTEWIRELEISPGAVYKKVHKGESFEEAIMYYAERKKRG